MEWEKKNERLNARDRAKLSFFDDPRCKWKDTET